MTRERVPSERAPSDAIERLTGEERATLLSRNYRRVNFRKETRVMVDPRTFAEDERVTREWFGAVRAVCLERLYVELARAERDERKRERDEAERRYAAAESEFQRAQADLGEKKGAFDACLEKA